MSMSIRTNVASLNAQRNLSQTQLTLDSSMSRLSSGFRIPKAGDDAAGLGISTKLEAQIRGYIQAEADGLIEEIDRISQVTKFNGTSLLNAVTTLTFQVGVDGTSDDTI